MHVSRDFKAHLVLLLALPLLLGVACGRPSPEERVAETRTRYNARLNGWIVDDRVRPQPAAAREEALEGMDSELDEELPAMAPPDLPPGPRDVILDIQLWHNSAEPLPGITLEVFHADAAERQKAAHRVWVDTSRLARGQHVQINEVLRDVMVEPGDRFSVQVRHPVPPEERGDYPEFQARG